MPGLFLTGINDTPLSSSTGAARPAIGQQVVVTVTVGNTGGSAGAFSVSGALVLSGTSTAEAHLGQNGSPTAPVAGSVGAAANALVTIYSGAMVAWNAPSPGGVANYNTSAGLDLIVTLTDTVAGTSTQYIVASAVFLPSEAPAALSVTAIAVGVT